MRRLFALYVIASLALVVSACSGNPGPSTAQIPTAHSAAHPAAQFKAPADSIVTPAASNALQNGGFETGSLSPWTQVGTGRGAASVTSAKAHSGTYSAFMGTSAAPEVSGLAGIEQSVTIPAGATLSMYVQGKTDDTIEYADQEAGLLDSTGKVVFSCFKILVSTTTWTQKSLATSAPTRARRSSCTPACGATAITPPTSISTSTTSR